METRVTVVSSATGVPISLEAVKNHLRLGEGYTEEDDFLKALRRAAWENAESVTRRKFMRQTLDINFDTFPANDQFTLPYGELKGVTSITYKNSSGNTQTLSTASYTIDTVSTLGRVILESTTTQTTKKGKKKK